MAVQYVASANIDDRVRESFLRGSNFVAPIPSPMDGQDDDVSRLLLGEAPLRKRAFARFLRQIGQKPDARPVCSRCQ